MPDKFDVLVAGAGPAGLVAALALGQTGFHVGLIGPRPKDDDDRRTTAIMTPALKALEDLGVGEKLMKLGAPLRTMRIADATSRLVRSPVVTFHASEIDEAQFGFNIPNSDLLQVLTQAVDRDQRIVWRETTVDSWNLGVDWGEAHLATGETLHGRLIAAADGRNSSARSAAGIGVRAVSAAQSALVLNFSHVRHHEFISCEFHTEAGPFTQVPLPGNRSSLVWVMRPDTAEDVMQADDVELSQMIEERMQSMLGRVTVDSGRQLFPLSSALPERFARRRVALIGEAAHIFPPIGAQGLNLGIRDVQQLAEVADKHRDDPGGRAALDAYDRRRRPDILTRYSAVNLLNRSLLSSSLPAQLVRAAGLDLLRGVVPVRSFFMREGLWTGSGISAVLGTLRK